MPFISDQFQAQELWLTQKSAHNTVLFISDHFQAQELSLKDKSKVRGDFWHDFR